MPQLPSLPDRQRVERDAESPLWCGSMDAVKAARSGRWFAPEQLAGPRATQYADVCIVRLAGLVTQSSWELLTLAIMAGEAAFGTRLLVLVIDSRAQQAAGYGLAIAALRDAGEIVTTHAHVIAAGGLAVSLAQACHYVTAEPTAPIGWLSSGCPLDGRDERSRFMPCDEGRGRGFTGELNRRLKFGSVHAEQLERRGVDEVRRGCIDAALHVHGLMSQGSL